MIPFRRVVIVTSIFALLSQRAFGLFGFGEGEGKDAVDDADILDTLDDDDNNGTDETSDKDNAEYQAALKDAADWKYDPSIHHYGRESSEHQETKVEYGLDVSFPTHHSRVSENYSGEKGKGTPQPLGNKQAMYDNFMNGCRKHYGKRGRMCDSTEDDRVRMSLDQPRNMVNYTDLGFKKIRCPPALWKKLEQFWLDNHDKQQPERWPTGNTYTNHWDAPTHMVSVDNSALRGQRGLKTDLWEAARETISDWTGQELTPVSLYGIRVYKEGAILAPHVDRMPLVSSAIVNVAQDVNDPWPIEVYAHNGKAYNVTMEPGDMVLYESHSVLHGRPFPLNGKFYANCFIHFEPIGHSARHHGIEEEEHDVDKKYKKARAGGQGGHEQEQSDGLPGYILRGSSEERRWRQQHPENLSSVDTGRRKPKFGTGTSNINTAAATGDIKTLEQIVAKDKSMVHFKDENGWFALHEAARSGHVHAGRFLVENGADVNARTGNGTGGSVLWLATNEHGADSAMVKFLKSVGGEYIEPDL
mmetsp:Transcript_13775/g.27488  ORF Transcript_13775/g.27488 Transcript_13775/m.27488 type:complete len:529 (-) Transcript_13775:82-1668(-)